MSYYDPYDQREEIARAQRNAQRNASSDLAQTPPYAALGGATAARQRLRDEFAMAALTSLSQNQGNPEWVAKTAYAIADAMLAARGGA